MGKKTKSRTGGVNISGGQASPRGDVVGRDKIVQEARAPVVLALHQLPPPPRDFTGRSEEIRDLMVAVEKGGVTISGLQGLGGVGKTALALKLAEHLTPRYPDAQFYMDLKGVSKEPLTPKAAMEYVIRAYHPDAKLPESEAELSGLYRSVLHEKKALLLMDNAWDARQVEPLIPPPSCMLLVTSRQRFTLPGLVPKNLDSLSPSDARSLLIRVAPRLSQEKKDYAGDLARLCGNLPLALRSVASTLAARINVSAADYVRKLTDAQDRLKLTATDACLQLSYDLLTEDLQKRLLTLSVFPDSFDAAGAAAVWEAESKIAVETLGEFLVYSLLEFNISSDRYRFHDLVRVFADGLLGGPERMVAQLRHAAHYKDVLAATEGLYLQGGQSVRKGLALFDAEWGNIQAGQVWTTAHASEDIAATRLCSQYPGASPDCLGLRVHPRERILWLEVSLAAAQQLKDRTAEGAHLGNLGIAYGSLGEYDRRSEGNSLGNLGNAYLFLGERTRAIMLYEQRLQIAQEIGDLHGEGTALGNLGNAYLLLGDYRRAIEYFNENIEIAHRIGDRRSEGIAVGNLGCTFRSKGDDRRAIEYHVRCLQIAREIGDLGSEGTSLWNMSLSLDKLGDRAEAIVNAEAALKIYEQIEHPSVEKVRKKLAGWRGNA
jgi:tetratricopeptide (TPR) repeat protein